MRPESHASGLALHSWCVDAGHSNIQPNDGCILGALASRRMKASVSRLQQVYSIHVAQNSARAVTHVKLSSTKSELSMCQLSDGS